MRTMPRFFLFTYAQQHNVVHVHEKKRRENLIQMCNICMENECELCVSFIHNAAKEKNAPSSGMRG